MEHQLTVAFFGPPLPSLPLPPFIDAMKVSRQRAHPRQRSELPEVRCSDSAFVLGDFDADRRNPGDPRPSPSPRLPPQLACLPEILAGQPFGYCVAGKPPSSGSVMRYRSATVAGSNGLPCIPGTIRKNKSRAIEPRYLFAASTFRVHILPNPRSSISSSRRISSLANIISSYLDMKIHLFAACLLPPNLYRLLTPN